MTDPIEVEWERNDKGQIVYAICHCPTVDRYDVRVYGEPGDGVVDGSPEFYTLEAARDWAESL